MCSQLKNDWQMKLTNTQGICFSRSHENRANVPLLSPVAYLSPCFPPLYPLCINLTSSFYMICSVSPVLDCGHTLVGGRKVVQLVCENKGGDGKFCIMRKSHWPSTTFQVWCVKCSLTSNVYCKASSMSGQEETNLAL